MAMRAVCSTLLLVLAHLTLLRGTASVAAAVEAPGPVVVATLVRTVHDVLPARVLMRSVLVHAAAPQTVQRVVFALPGAVPATAARQLSADGLEVVNLDFVPIPRRGTGVAADRALAAVASLTYTQLFRQTQYGRVVYLAPETLVKHDVAALAACPVFCAPFVSPCSFSTGVMVIQPNQTFYHDMMQAWPSHTCSHSANDNPDGLDEEACALNELLGMSLLNAPLFSVEASSGQNNTQQSSNALAEDLERGPMMRLPMGCQAPHVLYYPRLRFEIPVQPCGQLRVIDFGGPSVMQPWRWWTYSVMDLSWDWQKYRMQLHDPNSPKDGSRSSVWVRIFACQIAALVMAGLWNPCRTDHTRSTAVSDSDTSVSLGKQGGPDEQAFLVVAVGRGLFALFLSGVIAFSLTPDTLLPLDALVLFATYKCSAAVVLLIWHGRYCAAQALPSDVDEFPAPSSARAVWETVGWVLVDTIMLMLVFVFVNLCPVGSGYARLVMLAPFGFAYIFGLVFGLARVSMLWLAWGGGSPGDRSVRMQSSGRRELGSSLVH
jgi:hypothetical protein